MAQRLDTLMPEASSRPVLLLILFVSLFACTLVTGFPQHQQQQQRQQPPPAWRPQRPSVWKRAASEPGVLEPYSEPLYERPTVYAAAPQQAREISGNSADDNDHDDDEQFLRQLKVAAEYLDEKLAARQREQQRRALLAKLGRFVDSPDAAGPGPAYSLGGYDTVAGQARGNVVVVAPSVDSAPELSDSDSGAETFSRLDSPNYQLLGDDHQLNDNSKQTSELQQQQTYDNYKQLLQTLLGPDRAQPTQSDQPAALVKRESDLAGGTQSGGHKDDDDEGRPARAKLTTLVEEDERDDASVTTAESTAAAAAAAATNATTGTSSQSQATAYGKVVYKQNSTSAEAAAASPSGGVFGRMYAQLSRYLPFMNQISILRNPQSSGPDDETNETKLTGTSGKKATADDHGDAAHNDHDEHHHRDEQLAVRVSKPAKKDGDQDGQEELHAKPSVSVTLAHKKASIKQQQQQQKGEKDKTDEGQDNQNQADNEEDEDRHLKVKVSLVRGQDKENKSGEEEEEQQQQVANGAKSGNAKRLISPSVEVGAGAGPDNSEISELDVGQMMPVIIHHPPHYNHLMRHNQSPETETDQGANAASLLGKYIYAPTQHYYLSSVLPTTSGGAGPAAAADHQQLQNNARHFRPGDQVYGSYGLAADAPMKAAYAFQKDPSMIVNGVNPSPNSLANKTNDLYFLVMVGAFCVMAMAVVLAAGAFAYRVQQSRKSSQETDYPTYGVVGPNNMSGNGKCGASAFTMGGYFMGPPTGGAGSGTSKSGSAKHLADLYGHPAHGGGSVATSGRDVNGGSDSGLNSLGRSSHSGHTAKKAASSSASSLNNGGADNQLAGGRHAPAGGFMSAASQDAARMYHYQHQKQQMIISDRNSTAGGRHTSASDLDSEEENEDGSYTVYECPGLASAHEMEIKNPLFNDDQTP